MNKKLAELARDQIKIGLRKLEESHFKLFKRMYCHTNMDATIDEAVDGMDEDRLDTALSQVERTLDKLGL